ncbi:saccharopine dehydrogenase [NADP(+), L-glutamate-forming] [Colletotrichum liriopes]|uniref:Saccharopine dehydrogenase [NADP(+), L-glutamate-forming] n=1 Tax=Colletotrichum liriopes TaxID=708192 RepID=A0AA37GFP6_9PEZI|nr:saccharopine dehydrogenase [NADP(+), L-glutamate-forming] [Colletotrichum liriopes]
MADKKILVLGSGLVAKPCVDYLLRNERNKLTIACRTRATAQALASNHPRATAIALDVASPELNAHVAAHDLVISLVPFVHHPTVIKAGIKGNTHVVTTSYVSPAIRELGDEAQAAGITVLNEVGVDPGETRPPLIPRLEKVAHIYSSGVDHLYAIKTIDEVHSKGGKARTPFLPATHTMR